MNIYVSNLGFGVDTEELSSHFTQYGKVTSVNIIVDKFTNQSKGFGFVEMPEEQEAKQAIDGLNGFNLSGRTIKVSEAKPREERPERRDRKFF